MKTYPLALLLAAFFGGASLFAVEPANKTEDNHESVKATYQITGLHCPPCTQTVEESLKCVEGIESIKVDWKTKMVRVEFNEEAIPAQKVSQLIADTPHMMGSGMHYVGWLTLQSPTIRDSATAKLAEEALRKVEGIQQVVAKPAEHSLSIQFSANGALTSQQLIEILARGGINAKNM